MSYRRSSYSTSTEWNKLARTLAAHWWSPRRSLHTLGAELKQHPHSWLQLARPGRYQLSNYGDELNEFLLGAITGRMIRWVPLGKEDVVAVGSILVPYFSQGGVGQIWGSGLSEPSVTAEQAAAVSERFLAVRGPRTRDALGLPGDMTLGDPGLLVRTLGISSSSRRTKKLLIPHFTVYNSASGRQKMNALTSAGFTIAPPNLPVVEMLELIAGADFVASSGMHGMILSHALGTAVNLITFNETAGPVPGYKYGDYLASTGLNVTVKQFSTLIADSESDFTTRVELALAETESVAGRIDELNSGLLAASAPLK